MCFVWISEQTAIISLYSINWRVCITETECVYSAVRAESIKCILMFVPKSCALAQAVSRRAVTVEATVRSRSVHVRFVVEKVALGEDFLRILRFSPVRVIALMLTRSTYLHLDAACTTRKKGRSLGTFKKPCCFGDCGAFDRKILSLFRL
jgi:hypothetical protein